MRDPVASLQQTYEQLELDWPDGHDRRITDYLASKPKGKHGTHAYSLADVGLDDESVRATFAHYVEPLRHRRGVDLARAHRSASFTTLACGVSMSPSGRK